jgi:hypothetical protein
MSRLNGWQRLWLVGTVCLGLWLIGWWPLTVGGDARSGNWDYRRSIEKDFSNPACKDYQVRPLHTLREPAYDTGCWHIYTSRKYDDSATVPFTLEVYDRRQDEHWRNVYLTGLGLGTAATIVVSGLLYLIGWVIAWIIRGFRRGALNKS